ncbi:hypothetical protein, partial [Nostocoides japonicum]
MTRAGQTTADGGWGRSRLLATLAAGVAAALLFVVGLGLALHYGLRSADTQPTTQRVATKVSATGTGP